MNRAVGGDRLCTYSHTVRWQNEPSGTPMTVPEATPASSDHADGPPMVTMRACGNSAVAINRHDAWLTMFLPKKQVICERWPGNPVVVWDLPVCSQPGARVRGAALGEYAFRDVRRLLVLVAAVRG